MTEDRFSENNFLFSQKIVEQTRLWLDTPYKHQCSLINIGTDCLGLLRGVWKAIYGYESELPPPYTQDWSEITKVETLYNAALKHLIPIDDSEMHPGDIFLFRMRNGCVAKHLGIMSSPTHFIHSYSGHRVVENYLSNYWTSKIVQTFRFPIPKSTQASVQFHKD
jgi:NlpC/P60 family putative phage cell wall peptidase